MKSQKRWIVQPEAPPEFYSAISPIPKPIASTLFHRGALDGSAVRTFLEPQCSPAADPFLLLDMAAAVERIRTAIAMGEPIVIYGDYDADGVTATAMLVEFLRGEGGKATSYIPSRFEEGYGLNCAALEKLQADGAKLVISVDCGSRSVAEAEFCLAGGLDLIITDHHAPGDIEPRCLAFLDPKRPGNPYPDKDLAGVGVAYRLLQAMIRTRGGDVGAESKAYLDLVTLGTIADMAPLTGENRILVGAGLDQMRTIPNGQLRPGLRGLLTVAGLQAGNLNAQTVGYVLGPRLNAAGRLESAQMALELLLCRDDSRALELAKILEARNRERQTLTRSTFQAAKKILMDRYSIETLPVFLMVESEDFNPGVIGLAASRLADEFYRPSAVVTLEGEYARGSVRSIPGVHITEGLDSCREMLERYGGHAAAAGFTVRASGLPELRRRLEQFVLDRLCGELPVPELSIDSETRLAELNWEFLRWLKCLEPCGQGNPSPIYMARNLRVTSKRQIGKDGSHLRMTLTDGNLNLQAIAFGFGTMIQDLTPVVHVAFSLEENNYYGRELQMRIMDIHPGGGE